MDWNDNDLDLEEEFKERTEKSDAPTLTALTGTLDIAEPGLKMTTMTQRQRKNFNRGARAVSRQTDVIADCLKQNMLGPEGTMERPPERPMLCIVYSDIAELLTYISGCIVIVVDDEIRAVEISSNIRKKVEKENPSSVSHAYD